MRKSVFPALIFVLIFLPFVPVQAQQSQARTILEEMIRSIDNVRTMKGRIKRTERIDGKMDKGELTFKLHVDPFKVYLRIYEPDEGVEIMYQTGWNNGKAYVHPNRFPWVNVSLDPLGDQMLRNHHSIFSVGFSYTNRILRHVLKEYEDEFDEHVKYEGSKDWYGRDCYVLRVTYDDYRFESYMVKEGEDLFDVEKKLCIPGYKIIEINDGVDDFFDVEKGDLIQVPNVYAKEVVFYIDKTNFMPIGQLIYDEKGLFEKYEYHDLVVNPVFRTVEWTTDFDFYNF